MDRPWTLSTAVAALFASVLLLAVSTAPPVVEAAENRQSESGDVSPLTPAAMRAMAHDHFQWALEDQPVSSSYEGLHTWDDRLANYSTAAIRARHGRARAFLRRLDATAPGGDATALPEAWSADDRIAYALIRATLEGVLFGADVLHAEIRDPGLYVGECSNAIFNLLKKEYAPREVRARAATARLRAMPALLAQAKRNLTTMVPILARLAADSADGIGPLFTDSLSVLSESLSGSEKADHLAARDAALAALKDFASWLRVREPSMSAPLAMGKNAYNRMLSRVHLLPMDSDFVASLGQIELARMKALESWLPDPNAAETRILVDGPGGTRVAAPGIDLPKDQADFLARYEARTADLVAHIKRLNLLTIPETIGPFRIVELPKAFKPTAPGGFMNPPGLFDPDPSGFYFIPTYDPNSPNFYIRAAVQDPRPILGHEGIPGHFLQLSIAHALPDEIRRMHQDGVFVEGWGLYEEEMLLRTGLYADSPGGAAQVLRLSRYRAARITVDVKLHTGEWSFDEAVEYFMKEGGLDRESATGEAAGAAASPGQKIHYTLGKWQILRLLGRYRDAKGADFRLGEFHDRLLAQGSIPFSLVEWAILGDDASYREALARQQQ